MTRRRELAVATGLVLALLQRASLAQPAHRMRRIGFLSLGKNESEVAQIGQVMLYESLRRSGWEDGRNLVIERRSAEGDVARLTLLAEDLVRLDLELIVAALNPAVTAAMRATRTVPIVMIAATHPVETGFVETLARPGGNITGTALEGSKLFAKSMQILHELAPGRTRIAVLSGPAGPGFEQTAQGHRDQAMHLLQPLGMTVQYFSVRQASEISDVLQQIAATRAEVLMVTNSGVTEPRWREITSFAIQNKILSLGSATLFTSVGGAMYYGSNLQDIIDRSVSFVDRILRGAKPADLPVELPTRYDLILNLKALRAIGVTPPRSVLLQASEVIE